MKLRCFTGFILGGIICIFFSKAAFSDASVEFYFNRQEKFAEFSLRQNEKEEIHITARMDEDNNFFVDGSLKHMTLSDKEIAFNVSAQGHIAKENNELCISGGNITFKHIILNGSPTDNLSIDYDYAKREIFIRECHWENFDMQGRIALYQPFDVDMKLVISKMNLEDFVEMLGVKSQNLLVSGNILGFANIQHKNDILSLKAELYSWDGVIQDMPFGEANIILEGVFPSLRFIDSWLARKDNSTNMAIEGHFDLTKLSDLYSPSHNVCLVPTNKQFAFLNWVVSAKDGLKEGLSLQKTISNDITVSMDTFIDNNSTAEEPLKKDDSLSIEYKMKEDQKLKMSIKEKEEIVGWERVFKF